MTAHGLLQRLGIEHPILLAPMAGSGGTPELAAAVSNAGGLAHGAALIPSPTRLPQRSAASGSSRSRPFNINLFAGGYASGPWIDPQPMLAIVGEAHAKLGLPPPILPPMPASPFDAQLEAVLEERPPVFSFTFGMPSPRRSLRSNSAASPSSARPRPSQEARHLAEAGVDAIVVQGAEAGAHRGTFRAPFEDSMVPLATLLGEIAVAVALPVIASGGIMDGRRYCRRVRTRRRRGAAWHRLSALSGVGRARRL